MSSYQQYHPALDDPEAWVPYRYYPSLPAATAIAIIFGLLTTIHAIVLVLERKTHALIPFIIGGIFEFAGYVGRIFSAQDIWALGPYIVQSILLLVAPALFAASIYMILGRVIVFVAGEDLAPIPVRWLTKIFVAGDVVAFLLQMGGGGIQAGGTLELLNIGEKIIIAGLFAQIVFFGLFIVVATIFHRRYHSSRRVAGADRENSILHRIMILLYTTASLIMFRSIFRVIEYLMGNNGCLLRHEYFLYIFDALPMIILLLLFFVMHPRMMHNERKRGSFKIMGDTELLQRRDDGKI